MQFILPILEGLAVIGLVALLTWWLLRWREVKAISPHIGIYTTRAQYDAELGLDSVEVKFPTQEQIDDWSKNGDVVKQRNSEPGDEPEGPKAA